MMGGELFFSKDMTLIDRYFAGLLSILVEIRNKISVQIVTNLIHRNLGYVTDLMLRFRDAGIVYILNTSFDFGRMRFANAESY